MVVFYEVGYGTAFNFESSHFTPEGFGGGLGYGGPHNHKGMGYGFAGDRGYGHIPAFLNPHKFGNMYCGSNGDGYGDGGCWGVGLDPYFRDLDTEYPVNVVIV